MLAERGGGPPPPLAVGAAEGRLSRVDPRVLLQLQPAGQSLAALLALEPESERGHSVRTIVYPTGSFGD